MKKQNNTAEYRQDKRIAGFVEKDTKAFVLECAHKYELSMSKMLDRIIKEWRTFQKKI